MSLTKFRGQVDRSTVWNYPCNLIWMAVIERFHCICDYRLRCGTPRINIHAVFHTEGGVPWDFPPQSSSFPPQDFLSLLYFVLLSHPKWHQLPNIVISKAMILYETLTCICLVSCSGPCAAMPELSIGDVVCHWYPLCIHVCLPHCPHNIFVHTAANYESC